MDQTQPLREIVPSLIRTYVPSLVGALLAWLLTLGVNIDGTAQTAAVTFLTALLTGVYYTVVRLVERKVPDAGLALGSLKQPVSTKAENIVQLTAAKNAIVADKKAV